MKIDREKEYEMYLIYLLTRNLIIEAKGKEFLKSWVWNAHSTEKRTDA